MDSVITTPADARGQYWTGPLSRKEAQDVFDEYATALQKQGQQVMAMNMSVSYLMERFGIKPEDVAAWIKTKFGPENNAQHTNLSTSNVVQQA